MKPQESWNQAPTDLKGIRLMHRGRLFCSLGKSILSGDSEWAREIAREIASNFNRQYSWWIGFNDLRWGEGCQTVEEAGSWDYEAHPEWRDAL